MAILRKNNHEKYTVIDNDIVRDDRLTLKSFGLLIKLLALPDYWEFSEKGLEAIFKDGMTSIRSGLKDLEKFGYLKRTKLRDSKGRISNVQWEIFEKPLFPPESRFPILDNDRQSNTNISNTKFYIIGDDECIDLFLSLYEDITGKPHRKIKNCYDIENIDALESYDIDDLGEIVRDYLLENRKDKSKCTLEYFCKIIDRFR